MYKNLGDWECKPTSHYIQFSYWQCPDMHHIDELGAFVMTEHGAPGRRSCPSPEAWESSSVYGSFIGYHRCPSEVVFCREQLEQLKS